MEQKTKFLQVLEYLKKKGWTDEQITKLTEELAKTVFSQFYTEAISYLTNEDTDEIDKCGSQEEANIKIKDFYKLRTGRNPDEVATKFYDDFATKFFEEENAKTSTA